MGLLNGNAQPQAVAQGQAVAQDDGKKEAKKAKKEAKKAALAKVLEWAKANGTDEIKAAVAEIETKGVFGGGTDAIFKKAFPDAKPGMKITAFEMFERTDKNIRQFVKKCEEWRKDGKHFVVYNASDKTFTIEKL